MIGGKVTCAFGDVDLEIDRQSEEPPTNAEEASVQQFNFDQVYPGSESNPVAVILYNEIGSESSRQFHALLQERALQGRVKLINRHYVRRQINQKVRLSGYGVELHMKSTEYKSQDDSPKQADEDEAADAQDGGETEINGFDFAVLK